MPAAAGAAVRRRDDNAAIAELSQKEVAGRETHGVYNEASFEDALYSLGTEPPGTTCLGKYPNELRRFTRQDDGDTVDIATIDIIRDRERGVPRHNQFRRLLGTLPMDLDRDADIGRPLAAGAERNL